jgi:uncharacterized membrane protein
MAVAALVLWLCTAAVGSYLLASARTGDAESAATEEIPVAAGSAAPVRDRFAPESLRRSQTEPLPGGLKALAEFAHPALAFIGFGFWFGYVVSHSRVFLVICLGILLGAICAGVSWFIANTRENARAAKRAAEAGADTDGAEVLPGSGLHVSSPRLLILHGLGAALTLLFVTLLVARV